VLTDKKKQKNLATMLKNNTVIASADSKNCRGDAYFFGKLQPEANDLFQVLRCVQKECN